MSFHVWSPFVCGSNNLEQRLTTSAPLKVSLCRRHLSDCLHCPGRQVTQAAGTLTLASCL